MGTVLRALLAFVLGFVGGMSVSIATCFRLWDILGVHDHDGGAGMAVFFVLGPLFGFVSAILASTYVVISALRRGAVRPAGWQPLSPQAFKRRAYSIAIAAGMAVYLIGWAFIDLSGPWAPRSFVRSLFYNGIPLALGVAVGIWIFRSRLRATITKQRAS